MQIKAVKGGSNSPLHIWYPNQGAEPLVAKQYGWGPLNGATHLSLQQAVLLESDMRALRGSILRAGVPVPQLERIVHVPDAWMYDHAAEVAFQQGSIPQQPCQGIRLMLIETYVGVSLRELLRAGNGDLPQALDMAYQLVELLPEDIAIDAQPANFTWHNGKVFFVDFMPPKIWEYRNTPELVALFPTIRFRGVESDWRRRRQYCSKEGRRERFEYYVAKWRKCA